MIRGEFNITDHDLTYTLAYEIRDKEYEITRVSSCGNLIDFQNQGTLLSLIGSIAKYTRSNINDDLIVVLCNKSLRYLMGFLKE